MMSFIASDKANRWSFSDIFLSILVVPSFYFLGFLINLIKISKNFYLCIFIIILLSFILLIYLKANKIFLSISTIISIPIVFFLVEYPINYFIILLIISLGILIPVENREKYSNIPFFVFSLLATLLFYNLYSDHLPDYTFNFVWTRYGKNIEKSINEQISFTKELMNASYNYGFYSCYVSFLNSSEILSIDYEKFYTLAENKRKEFEDIIKKYTDKEKIYNETKNKLKSKFYELKREIVFGFSTGFFLIVYSLFSSIIKPLSKFLLKIVKF